MISRTRSVTILSGVGLAAVLFVLFSLAGIGTQRTPVDRSRPGPATLGDAQTASQPALRQAMLTAADLPPGYAGSPAPARPGGRAERVPECRALFERLALPGAPRPLLGDPTHALRQAVTVFDPSAETAAADAYSALRAATARCPSFRATLDDGTDVTVQMTEAAPLAEVQHSFLVRLTATTAGRTLTGYLSAGRVGRVVSVLRHLGPEGVIRVDDASTLLRRALAKVEILDGLLHREPA